MQTVTTNATLVSLTLGCNLLDAGGSADYDIQLWYTTASFTAALGAEVRNNNTIWVQATPSGTITGACPSNNAPVVITGLAIPLTLGIKTGLSAISVGTSKLTYYSNVANDVRVITSTDGRVVTYYASGGADAGTSPATMTTYRTPPITMVISFPPDYPTVQPTTIPSTSPSSLKPTSAPSDAPPINIIYSNQLYVQAGALVGDAIYAAGPLGTNMPKVNIASNSFALVGYSPVSDPGAAAALVYNDHIFFGTGNGKILQVDVSQVPPAQLSTLLLEAGESPIQVGVQSGIYGYYGTYTSPGRVIKVDLTNKYPSGRYST